jgi:hypothetical protein
LGINAKRNEHAYDYQPHPSFVPPRRKDLLHEIKAAKDINMHGGLNNPKECPKDNTNKN